MAAVESAGQLISAHPPGSPECERGLAALRDLARGPGAPAAQWLLGTFYLPKFGQKGAHAEAIRWLEQAAASGVPPALDRLANLFLRGIGVRRDTRAAFTLLERLAHAGFQGAAWDLGYLLDHAGDEGAALENVGLSSATAFARAAALAYPPAYYSLGLRFARGAGVDPDPWFARALLWRAEEAQYPDAREAAAELDLPSRDHPEVQRWHQALTANVGPARALLQRLAHDGITIPAGLNPLIPQLEAQFARLGHPRLRLGPDGRLQVAHGSQGEAVRATSLTARDWQWLAQDPRVAVLPGFATREECAHLRYVSGPSLAEPREYTGDTVNGAFETIHFKGRAHSLGAMYSDTVVRVLEQRIATSLDWQLAAIEPCSVIAYQPGQFYETHADFFSLDQIARNREQVNDLGGQRMITFLLCILAAEEGGGTIYPHANLTVRHTLGQAAIHYNVTPAGEPDPHSLHRGLPVGRGEKWLLRTTLRERSRYAIDD